MSPRSRSPSPRSGRRPPGSTPDRAPEGTPRGTTRRRPSSRDQPEGARKKAPPTERLGAADEPFWLGQEGRLTDQLGQPCCSVSGICTLLGRIAGPLAVIPPRERDCGNSFVHHRFPAPHRFFTTGVSEEQATTGQVDAPLAECLRLVLEESAPAAVLVLHTCLLSMIGSDPRRVIEDVVKDTATTVPVVYLDTGGLRLSSQADMADWLYATLAALPQLPPKEADWRERWLPLLEREGRLLGQSLFGPGPDPVLVGDAAPEAFLGALRGALVPEARPEARIVNLIGVEPTGLRRSEVFEVLGRAGVKVAGVFPEGAPLEQWQRISLAQLNAVVDVKLYPRLLGQLEQGYGMETVEVPLPTGLAQSERFYALLGERLGVGAELGAAIEAHREAAAVAVERFRRQVNGVRLALGLRMLNNYVAD